jgi:hypothetical protein
MPEEVISWAWTWGPPNGPSRTAHFGQNLPFDIVRILLCVASFIMVALTLRVLAEQRRRDLPMSRAQTYRFLGQVTAGVLIGVDLAYTVGTTAGPRLIGCAVFITLAMLGVIGKRRLQLGEPMRKEEAA